MNIRRFNDGDRKVVISLWEKCGLTRPWNDPEKDIDRKVSFQPELFIVGELDGVVIASAMAGYDGHRGSVYYLAVDPNHQGKGFGRMVMEEIEKQLTSMGCSKINIAIRTSNGNVLAFYQSLEYTTDDVVSMGKRLIPDI